MRRTRSDSTELEALRSTALLAMRRYAATAQQALAQLTPNLAPTHPLIVEAPSCAQVDMSDSRARGAALAVRYRGGGAHSAVRAAMRDTRRIMFLAGQ